MAAQSLKLTYVGDASHLSSTLAKIDKEHATLASKLKSVGSSLTSAGKSMTLGFTLPIVAGFALAIREATEFAQVQAQTKAGLVSTAGAANVTAAHVTELATTIGHLSAQDGELVQAGENVLLTFIKVSNQVGAGNDIFDQASLAVADLSARMGTDLSSASLTVGKALNDPIKGMTALQRIGVLFTADQKAMISQLVGTGDAMGAQKIILGELNTEFGGSAKAMGDAASPLTKLMLSFNDMAQSLGVVLIPMVQAVADWFAKLATGFEAMSPAGKKVVIVLELILAAVGPLLLIFGKLATVIGIVIKLVQSQFVAAIARAVAGVALYIARLVVLTFTMGVTAAAQQVMNDASAAMGPALVGSLRPIGLAVIAVGALAYAFTQGAAEAKRLGSEVPAAVDSMQRSLGLGQSSINQFNDSMLALRQMAVLTGLSLDDLRTAAMPGLIAALERGHLNAEQFTHQAVLLGASGGYIAKILTGTLNPALDQLTSHIDASGQKVKNFSGMTTDAFKTFVASVATGWDSVSGVLTDLRDGFGKSAQSVADNYASMVKAAARWARDVAIITDSGLTAVQVRTLLANQDLGDAWVRGGERIKTAIQNTIDKAKAAATSEQHSLDSLNTSKAVAAINNVTSAFYRAIEAAAKFGNSVGVGPPGGGGGRPGQKPLASGTSNFSGGLALVGEIGPELVSLPRGSGVSTAAETQRLLGGGGTMNVSIVVNGSGDPQAVAQAVKRELVKHGQRNGFRVGLA